MIRDGDDLAETRKRFLYCRNCTETYYIRFQLTETLQKLFSMFLHCWNWTETYTSGFRWRKFYRIQLKLYNSFRIVESKQETSTPSFYIVSAEIQFLLKLVFFIMCFIVTWEENFTQSIKMLNFFYHPIKSKYIAFSG